MGIFGLFSSRGDAVESNETIKAGCSTLLVRKKQTVAQQRSHTLGKTFKEKLIPFAPIFNGKSVEAVSNLCLYRFVFLTFIIPVNPNGANPPTPNFGCVPVSDSSKVALTSLASICQLDGLATWRIYQNQNIRGDSLQKLTEF